MPPRNQDDTHYDVESTTVGGTKKMYYGKSLSSNAELVPDAGKIQLEKGNPWGRGILQDMKRTVGTHWLKEMTNLNQKTVAVTLFLFIAVIAPTLSFGAIYGKTTDNRIGAVETILATSWVGVTYSLIGGMPLCIIGSTGPVLAFTRAVVTMADNMDVPFLTLNAWISVWIFAYTFIAGFFDLTRFVRLATRFLDEIFALLIVSIFVLDAVGDPFSPSGILRYFQPDHGHHGDFEEDANYDFMEVALLSTILGFGTTALIFFFRSFKFSPFFCNDSVRTAIHDFSVSASVLIATIIKEFLFPDIETDQFNVPDQFEPTYQCCDSSCKTFFPDDCPEQESAARSRNWFVDFSDLNGKGYVPIMAAAPALLAFVLVYLDNGITWHLINHKSHNLQHGEAYNYDLVLNGFFNFVNGMLGLPWLVATTVPCIIHLNALAEKDKDGNFISVQETRLTMLFSHLLVGLCLLFLNVLQLLPMPVLYGVFLFMGLSSLPNMQFWQRFLMFFQQPSKYAQTPYNKHIKKSRVHMYTCFQIFFFGLVFLVQNFPQISIVFPLMTLLCIPARLFLLPRFFEGWELLLLDGEDEEIKEFMTLKEENGVSKIIPGEVEEDVFSLASDTRA
jgi:hypothetical protein